MGVDVHGRGPTEEAGEYFRNSWWSWRPLAAYAQEVAPEITKACTYWGSNDGDGLDGAASIALADRLQAEIDAGRTLIYEKKYTSALEAMPNEPCDLCGATGKRADMEVADGCNKCAGEGYVRPNATHYPFDVENVQKFVTFLRASGGFSID